MKTNVLRWSVIIVTVTGLLSSCLKDDDDTPDSPTETYISLMHLAPTAPSLDVFFDNNKVSSTPFVPGTVTATYNTVEKGTFSIKFKKASVDSLVADVGQAKYDSLTFYTVLLYNLITDGPVRAIRIKDDFTEAASNLTIPYYRFFHASPNTGPVDVYLDTIKLQSGRVHADNAGSVTLNSFQGTIADIHKIEVREAGTSTVIASQNNVFLQPGNAYTFYLTGLTGGTGDKQLKLGIQPAFQ